jgi:6-phosphogluconate dehydrogenase (decarboxylating)
MVTSSVTCIGIGNMGSAMAQALLNAKTPVTLWNRTPDRPQVTALVAAGATFNASIDRAIDNSDIILICVLDYDAIRRIIKAVQSPSVLQGKTIVNLTNGTPRDAREMDAWAKSQGAKYLDGGIMVTPQLVGTPHSFVLLSGEDEGLFSARNGVGEVLAPLGNIQYVSSDAGAAATQDLAALAAMYGMFYGAFVGMGLLKKQKPEAGDRDDGRGRAKVTPAVDNVVIKVLTALVPYLHGIAESTDQETWSDNMGNPLDMQLAGVQNIINACKEEGVDTQLFESLRSFMQQAVDDSWGNGGVAVVGKYMRK